METQIEDNIDVVEKKDKGFTLVELLIVIVILGILATVTVFAVRGITDQGQQSACKADQKTLEVAVEAYYAQFGKTVAATDALLVSSELLRSPSTTFAVAADGITVSPISGADCDIPPFNGTPLP